MREIFIETQVIRRMERGGYDVGDDRYIGMMSGPVDGGTGRSRRGGGAGVVVPRADAMTRQVGHLLNLRYAPCEAENPDPYYPYDNGAIGAWGYDSGAGELVSPATPDLMSYCGPARWISDYHFTNAYSYRLVDEHVRSSVAAAATRSLLLWGGVDADGRPYLEPALVVDAPPSPPLPGGDRGVTGWTAGGEELFSLRFAMPEVGGRRRWWVEFRLRRPGGSGVGGPTREDHAVRAGRNRDAGFGHGPAGGHSAQSAFGTGPRNSTGVVGRGAGGRGRKCGSPSARGTRGGCQPGDSRPGRVEAVGHPELQGNRLVS